MAVCSSGSRNLSGAGAEHGAGAMTTNLVALCGDHHFRSSFNRGNWGPRFPLGPVLV